MPQLFSDLLDSGSRRYFFALTSAPGAVQPTAGLLRVNALAPTILITSTVFRTPAPAVITVQSPALALRVPMQPPPAVITQGSAGPSLLKQMVITNAVNADYSEPVSFAPTIAFIQTITPTPGLVTLQPLEFSLTQGGDIGFISPGVGRINLVQNLNPTLIFFESEVGQIIVQGLAPTLLTSTVVQPEPAVISLVGAIPEADLGFVWIDVTPPPPLTWTPTTGISS